LESVVTPDGQPLRVADGEHVGEVRFQVADEADRSSRGPSRRYKDAESAPIDGKIAE
jgi:hypothetical protein